MSCNDDVCDIFPEENGAIDYIYVITIMTKVEEMVSSSGKKMGIPDFGDSRTTGYYYTYDDARDAVVSNLYDMWETIYDYALIEKVAPGVFNGASTDDRSLFKYNKDKDKYEPIEEPKILNHIYGIGIG